MILSDVEIREALDTEKIEITPAPAKEQFDTSSLDLRLGHQFKRYKRELAGVETIVDPAVFDYREMSSEYTEVIETSSEDNGSVVIKPGVRVAMERKPGVFGDHAVSVRDGSSGVDASHALPGRARR